MSGRRQEGGNVFSDKIRVGIAIYFLVRRKGLDGFRVFYNVVDDYAKAFDKIAYVNGKVIDDLKFAEITPDAKSNWLDQSHSDFEQLLPLANREAKLAKTVVNEQAVFGLYSMGVVTNRDEWVYDFDQDALGNKVRAFINEYEESRALHGGRPVDDAELGTIIKWTRDLKRQLRLDSPNLFERQNVRRTLFRPFVAKHLYFSQSLNEMQYQLPEVFPKGTADENLAICFCVNGKAFYALAADRVVDLHFTGDTQCLLLYRYTSDGERVSNITDWGLRQLREHYDDDAITAEDIFAYVYAMLHDPAYRQQYEVDLRREFPRVVFQEDFAWWAQQGRELLDLHIGFETAEPWPLERLDQNGVTPTRAILRADNERGVITLDEQTSLQGVPTQAWEYRLGNRSALEWVLDQYKERKPRDPTIRERFNTYRFADHKEHVIDLLGRVCAVSAFTTNIVGELSQRSAIKQE